MSTDQMEGFHPAMLSAGPETTAAKPGKDLRVRSLEEIEAVMLGLGECQFCHNSDIYINDAPVPAEDGDATVIYQAECVMCGMSSPWCDTPEEAAAVWERMQIGGEGATNPTNDTKGEGSGVRLFVSVPQVLTLERVLTDVVCALDNTCGGAIAIGRRTFSTHGNEEYLRLRDLVRSLHNQTRDAGTDDGAPSGERG